VPLALLAAWGFHWLIERPSHRLARRASAIAASGTARMRGRLDTLGRFGSIAPVRLARLEGTVPSTPERSNEITLPH
jgi:hypothetical protein